MWPGIGGAPLCSRPRLNFIPLFFFFLFVFVFHLLVHGTYDLLIHCFPLSISVLHRRVCFFKLQVVPELIIVCLFLCDFCATGAIELFDLFLKRSFCIQFIFFESAPSFFFLFCFSWLFHRHPRSVQCRSLYSTFELLVTQAYFLLQLALPFCLGHGMAGSSGNRSSSILRLRSHFLRRFP